MLFHAFYHGNSRQLGFVKATGYSEGITPKIENQYLKCTSPQ